MIKDVIIHKITSSRGRYSGGSTHGQGTKKSRQGLDPCRHEAVQAARQGEHTDARHGPEARPHAGGGAAEGEPGRHFAEAKWAGSPSYNLNLYCFIHHRPNYVIHCIPKAYHM